MDDESKRLPGGERDPAPIIVKASVEQSSRSPFKSGFTFTLGGLLALFVVFVVVPALIGLAFHIFSAGIAATDSALNKREDLQRERKIRQLEIEREQAAKRDREAEAKARELARQVRERKAQPRKWHTGNGILLHEGTWVGCNETSVTIKLENGDLAAISIEALSTKDQEYINFMMHGNEQ